MIAYVAGKLGETWGTTCLVVTSSDVGYAVALPGHTFANLPPRGEQVAFYTSMVVRDDAFELFGFETFPEKLTFEILRTISKVGPRTALALLTTFRPADLQKIAHNGELSALTKVSGIGKKTGQHILVELKDKLKISPKTSSTASGLPGPSLQADMVAALVNLGYDEEEVSVLVKDIISQGPDLDEQGILRAALKKLSTGRS